MLNRRQFIQAAVAGAGAVAAPGLLRSARSAGKTEDRPNILFIMTDQQHAGMMGCTGNTHVKTPALDALAASGVRFERAYATNPVCVPSRFSLQTGYLPSAVGMRLNNTRIRVPAHMIGNSLGLLLRRRWRAGPWRKIRLFERPAAAAAVSADGVEASGAATSD